MTTDQARLLAFLDGAQLRYEFDESAGLTELKCGQLDSGDIHYYTYASTVQSPIGTFRFAKDGHLASISHRERGPR